MRTHFWRHPRAGGDPGLRVNRLHFLWIPASAGMTRVRGGGQAEVTVYREIFLAVVRK